MKTVVYWLMINNNNNNIDIEIDFLSVSLSLICSGAEQAQEIYSHIRDQTQKHLDSYAREGLRTLCIAKKVTHINSFLLSKCYCSGKGKIVSIFT